MKRLIASPMVVLVASTCAGAQNAAPAPRDVDRALVTVLAVSLAPDRRGIWPGYDPADIPLLVYLPGQWSILVDPPPEPLDGWAPYPEAWPALSRPALFRTEPVDGLVGQLSFDYEINGRVGVAIPLFEAIPGALGARDPQLLAYLMHEHFHQYQRAAFADVNTPSEEAYPMLDPANNALATLEMRAVEDALEELAAGDTVAARRAAELAVAVRQARWAKLNTTGRSIEVSKEVVEGTAKYVEARSVDRVARWCGSEPAPGLEICGQLAGRNAVSWLLEDLERRYGDGVIPPADMARNRIYPVGAGVGLLLDRFAPEWKSDVQATGTETGLFHRLAERLDPGPRSGALLSEAEARFGWDRILAESRRSVDAYLDGFEEAMAEFRVLSGTRVVVELPTEGVTRGRSSREQRWVVDEGRTTLGRFVRYTLRRQGESPILLSMRDVSVLDEVGGNEHRRVTTVVPAELEARVDGSPMGLEDGVSRSFDELELTTQGFSLESDSPGTLSVVDGVILIRIE